MDFSTFLSSQGQETAEREPQFLGQMSSQDFLTLRSGGETLPVATGEMLIAEGAQDTSLYILLEGEVEVLVPTEKSWMRVAVLHPGSVIGEMAFLDNLPRSARVIATTPSSALRISREAFQEFARREPTIALIFIWELSRTVSFRMRRVERFDAAEVAREEERKSLAAELHDETMGDMGSMAVELGFMKREAARISPEMEASLDELRERLRATDRRLREIVQGIFPPALTLRGLAVALNSSLTDLASHTIANPYPLEVELRTTGFDRQRLPEDVEIGVYRVVLQAVANAIKHAQAKKVRVDLTWADSELAFSIADDGTGFDVANPRESPATGHFGLVNLRDRTERLMGTLDIQSRPSLGTTIRGRVPVPPGTPRPTEVQTALFLLNNEESPDAE